MKSTTIASFEDYLSYTSEFPREGRVFRGVSDSVYRLGFNHERMFPGLDGAATLLEWRFANNIGKWHSG
jgi:hypothetical protein